MQGREEPDQTAKESLMTYCDEQTDRGSICDRPLDERGQCDQPRQHKEG